MTFDDLDHVPANAVFVCCCCGDELRGSTTCFDERSRTFCRSCVGREPDAPINVTPTSTWRASKLAR